MLPMRSIPGFLKYLSWALAGGLSSLAGCAAEPLDVKTPACRCAAEPGCAEADCPIEVVLGEGCEGQVSLAEVVIDGHLEAQAVRPGEVLTACSRIPFGGVARVAARGGDWLWGPLDEACTVPGETRRLVFDCSEFGAPVDAGVSAVDAQEDPGTDAADASLDAADEAAPAEDASGAD